MKEDILEQLVDGWFVRQSATFTKHNVKYKPLPTDIAHLDTREKSRFTVSSDIDVLAIHLNEQNVKTVSVVSCKSWQNGFDIDDWYKCLIDEELRKERVGAGSAWKKFRELVEPTWSKAFRDAIYRETNSHDFTYYIAITKIRRGKNIDDFRNCSLFLNNLTDNGKHNVKIEFLTLEKMLFEIFNEPANTTIEATEIGRFMQLIKAAGLKLEQAKK